jgi:hypothetical protein
MLQEVDSNLVSANEMIYNGDAVVGCRPHSYSCRPWSETVPLSWSVEVLSSKQTKYPEF